VSAPDGDVSERGFSGTIREGREDLSRGPVGDKAASDSELVGAVRKGDARAFESLVRRYLPSAHGIALAITRDPDQADDVCQDAFVIALQRLGQLREGGSFRSWLLTIVRNRALNLLSGERRRAALPLEAVREAQPYGGPEADFRSKEIRSELKAALPHLTALQRQVFVLHDVEGMDHEEIALSLGISSGSSRVHLHMARRRLRNELGTKEFLEA
jgi:RNA polymerase sigma-70 factor (ECF subfamily)